MGAWLPVQGACVQDRGALAAAVTGDSCGQLAVTRSGSTALQCLLKWSQFRFFVFQSETSFNLISEKCDILSILRDHPENRIYHRKIQVRRVGSRGS